jgi:hypothetical protein
MDTVALRLPLADGVKVTLTAQLAFTASVVEPVGQLLVWLKSAPFAPVTLMLLIVNGAPPELVSVTVWAGLVLLTAWLLNIRLVGLNDTTGGVGVVFRNLVRIFVVIC